MVGRYALAIPWFLALGALLAAALAYPAVLGHLLAADGHIDSLRARLLLTASSVGAAALGLSLVVVAVRGMTVGRLGVAILSASCAVALYAAIVATFSWRQGHPDVRRRLIEARLSGAVRVPDVAVRSDDDVLTYFTHRPIPPSVTPYETWELTPRSRPKLERVIGGALGELAQPPVPYFWKPGSPIDWQRLPNGLDFQLERQTFILEGFGLLPGSDTSVSAMGLALGREWRREHRAWPDFHTYGWNDDATSHRSQALIATFSSLQRQGAVSREDYAWYLQTILQHAEHLASDHEHNYDTNHGFSQDAALLLIASTFPELDVGGQWRATALARAERYLADHVADDGASLELAPAYHLFITSLALWIAQEASLGGAPMSADYERKLRRMATFVCAIEQPDGTFPRIADTEGQKPEYPLWPWSELPSWPELAALKACLNPAAAPPNSPGALNSPAGYFALRAKVGGWSVSQALHATMICGPVSHAHAQPNKLAITAFAHGASILSGPGYPSFVDPARDSLVTTAHQNTISVDGHSQQSAPCTARFADTRTSDEDHIFAAVSGTIEPEPGVEFARTFFYGPQPGEIVLVDDLRSNAPHDYESHFNAAPGVEVASDGATLTFALGADVVLMVREYQLHQGALVPLPASTNAGAGSYRVRGRSEILISRISVSGPRTSSALAIRGGRLVWEGESGKLDSALPPATSRDYAFSSP